LGQNGRVHDLLDKRLLFVTGKGGVGKSTVALALGLAAAERGMRTIVCEVASQEHTSRVFRRAEVGFHEVEMRENLWTISIDPDHSLREYLTIQAPIRAMGEMLSRSRVFTYLTTATPGLKELVTIGKIWELAQLDRRVRKGAKYDLVLVDSPATGHGIGFLQTPRTFAGIARVGPIRNQAQALDTFITDHGQTGAVIVALPEEMPVNESELLERELTGTVGVSVDRVYMNALYPERFSEGDAKRLDEAADSLNGGARAAVRAALSERRRALAQRAQLQRLRNLVETPVSTLPFVFEPELGVAGVERLAGEVA
jgi:anion-transporting  ArsA/GET3 family ATPase